MGAGVIFEEFFFGGSSSILLDFRLNLTSSKSYFARYPPCINHVAYRKCGLPQESEPRILEPTFSL